MAKKEEKVETPPEKEISALALTKALIKDFNKDSKEKMAWCLGTDLDNPTEVKEFISTGSTLLDYIIANKKGGGIPVGKLTEICGEEASGKSLICAHLIAECQRRGGIAIYIDTENAAHPPFMQQIGVNIHEMVYLQPGTVEEVGAAIEKTILMARAKAPNKLVLIIWDSVAGTPCQAEIEGTYDPNDRIGVTAKALAKMMRKLTQVWGKERIAMVFTNQLKVKIGVQYGDPMSTPGGKAIPYHASVRIRLTRGQNEQNEKTKEVYGVHTSAKIIKSRLSPPLRKCKFDIFFQDGIHDVNSWFEYLHEAGEITKSDGWCYLTSFKGKENIKHPEWGHMFREKQWDDEIGGNPALKQHVLDLIDKQLVVRYDQKEIKDLDLDPESLMDAESVLASITNT